MQQCVNKQRVNRDKGLIFVEHFQITIDFIGRMRIGIYNNFGPQEEELKIPPYNLTKYKLGLLLLDKFYTKKYVRGKYQRFF